MDVGGGEESIADSRRPSLSSSMSSSSSTVSAAAAAVRRLLHRRVPLPVEFIKDSYDDDCDDDYGDGAPDDDDDDNDNDNDNDNDDDDSSPPPVGNYPRTVVEGRVVFPSTPPSTSTSASRYPPSLESLPPDVSSRILSHLLPHELHSFALASRTAQAMFDREELWRAKFSRRWNCVPDPLHRVVRASGASSDASASNADDAPPPSSSSGWGRGGDDGVADPGGSRGEEDGGDDSGFWKRCYVEAHRNPHDLWVRHWNCVSPEDATTCAGRTVVPDVAFAGRRGDGRAGGGRRRRRPSPTLTTATANARVGCEGEEDRGEDLSMMSASLRRDFDRPTLRHCPTCRYHPMVHPRGYDDVFEAIDAEAEFARLVDEKYECDDEYDDDDDDGGRPTPMPSTTDPVERAEAVAAAHAILANRPPDIVVASGSTAGSPLHSTAARAVHYSTLYSVAKWCRNVRRSSIGGIGRGEGASSSLSEGYYCATRGEGGRGVCRDDGEDDDDDEGGRCLRRRRLRRLPPPRRRDGRGQGSGRRVAVRERAEYAFACASTHDRRIRTSQYQSSGVTFLTDALFFDVRSSHERGRRTSSTSSRERLCGVSSSGNIDPSSSLSYDPPPPEESIVRLGPDFETSRHTWHVVRLSNPDFALPITFRAYVQSDHFAVYPSEGYLRPGATAYLVLGVRVRGSLTNEEFERFDIERECDGATTTTGTHLPLVPFAVRYMLAPPVACVPHGYSSRPSDDGDRRSSLFAAPPGGAAAAAQNNQTPSESAMFPPVLDHLWDNVSAAADVRTIFLSAHVHSNYGFDLFQDATLAPFDISSNGTPSSPAEPRCVAAPLTAILPNLSVRCPELLSALCNLDAELEDSAAGESYRTEKRCELCRRDWGQQSELLGRSYVLRKLECQKRAMIRARQRMDFQRTINMVPSLLRRSLTEEVEIVQDRSTSRANRICQLLYVLYMDYLLQANANKLVTRVERLLFGAYERYVEETYADLQIYLNRPGGATSTMILPWKKKGRPKNSISKDAFLGRQDDMNHQEAESHPPMHTDMFQNDPVKGFACAISMIIHPESLVGHGVWDRVQKPGYVIRCPSLPIDTFFRTQPYERDQLSLIQKAVNVLEKSVSIAKVEGWKSWNLPQSSVGRRHFKVVNYELNEQDPDGLGLITTGSTLRILFHTSLAHYLCNVPIYFAPKTGETHLHDTSILALYTRVQPYTHVLFPARTGETRPAEQNNQQRSNPQIRQNQQQGAVDDINVLWMIARHFGWVVDDEENRGSILIDRRLLIATQWLSNTIMTFSLLASLLSRKFLLITPFPVGARGTRGMLWQDMYTNLSFTNSVHTARNMIR